MTDKQIRNLLEQIDRTERQLVMLRARLDVGRRAFADRNGLFVPPRIETLRLAVLS